MPGRLPVCTQEGVHAVDEAIRFLRHARPFPALALSPGLCSAAADHCREQALAVSSDITGAMGAMQEAEISRYGVAIAGTFSTRITTRPERLTVRMPDTVVFAVSILPGATTRARSYVLEPMPRIRFNDATPTIGRGAAEAALFRESVERMDRP